MLVSRSERPVSFSAESLLSLRVGVEVYDLVKWKPVFGKDRAQTKDEQGVLIQRKLKQTLEQFQTSKSAQLFCFRDCIKTQG